MKILEFFQGDSGFSMSRLITFIGCLISSYAVLKMVKGWVPTWPAVLIIIAFLAYSCGAHVYSKFLTAASDAAKSKNT